PVPDLLVHDEPTPGMDVTALRYFWRTMHADADRGRTILFATHYLEEADDFADRIILMSAGRVVADGTTEQIRARGSGRTVSADVRRGTSALRSIGCARCRAPPGAPRPASGPPLPVRTP